MRRATVAVCATLILGALAVKARSATAQDNPSSDAASDATPADSGVVTGQPFAATKYSRQVKVLPDGKQTILREHHQIELARDAAGRIRMKGGGELPYDCQQPTPSTPPTCSVENVFVFDPTTQTITHWPEGEFAGKGAVTIGLSAAQLVDAENATAVLPQEATDAASQEDHVITEELGEKVIEGVRATGVRTTTILPAGDSGNRAPVTRIHEVWMSPEMKLVIRIVDGDPQGKQTISGLEHISHEPDPALFQPPPAYPQWRRESSAYADIDMKQLPDWFVQ